MGEKDIKLEQYNNLICKLLNDGYSATSEKKIILDIVNQTFPEWENLSKEEKSKNFAQARIYHANKKKVNKLEKIQLEKNKQQQKVIDNVDRCEQLKEISITDDNIKEVIEEMYSLKNEKLAIETFVEYIINKNIIKTLHLEKKDMAIYNGRCYDNNDDNPGKKYIKVAVEEVFKEKSTIQLQREIINKVANRTIIKDQSELRKEYPYLIPLQEGILNLKSIKLKEFNPVTNKNENVDIDSLDLGKSIQLEKHDPEKLIFSEIKTKYDPYATCPQIMEHINFVLNHDKEQIDLLQQAFGNNLIKKYINQYAVMFKGTGRNGKGVIIDALMSVLGSNNCKNFPLNKLCERDSLGAELFGKLLNICPDMDSSPIKTTENFKAWTGDNEISLDRKFRNSLTFRPYAKFFFSCNTLPMVYDDSDGFWDRWIIFEFTKKFISRDEFNLLENSEKDKYKIKNNSIKEKLLEKKELEGFFIWILRGALKLIQNDGFKLPSNYSFLVKKRWDKREDKFSIWCENNLKIDINSSLTLDEIKREYIKYCDLNEERPVGKTLIQNIIKYDWSNDYYTTSRIDPNGVSYSIKVYGGVAFKNEKLNYSYKLTSSENLLDKLDNLDLDKLIEKEDKIFIKEI